MSFGESRAKDIWFAFILDLSSASSVFGKNCLTMDEFSGTDCRRLFRIYKTVLVLHTASVFLLEAHIKSEWERNNKD